MKKTTRKNANTVSPRTPTHEEIERRAFALWQENGGPSGRDQEFWYRAERELSGSPAKSRTARGAKSDEEIREFEEKLEDRIEDYGSVPPRSPTTLDSDSF